LKKKNLKFIRSSFVVVLIFVFAALFVSRCGVAVVPVTIRYAYKPILKYRWESRFLVEHFPTEIPDEAKDIKFYYRAGFMQGGTTIELRMQMPQREFDAIAQKHRVQAKLILDHLGNDSDTKSENKVYFAPILNFYTVSREELTDDYKIGPLPVGYEIFFLHIKEYKQYWNHGKTAGIAVSQLKNEIIYWAEVW
jgi:hypothetical protein